jgi:hypothetical protein
MGVGRMESFFRGDKKMQAFCANLKKKGRPPKFSHATGAVEEKKRLLFGAQEGTVDQMSLVNLAYHSNKINEEERDTAEFLGSIYFKVQRGLGVKQIPHSSPNTWNAGVRNLWDSNGYYDEKSAQLWEKIKFHLSQTMQYDAADFLKMVTAHYSYEELLIMKMNLNVMGVLKKGLLSVKKLIDNEII